MIKQRIEKIAEYLKDSEQTHYEESEKPEEHIYLDALAVEEWLNSPSCPLVDSEELEDGN